MIRQELLPAERRADLPLDLVLAMLVDPDCEAAEAVAAAVLFDPAFTAVVDAGLQETPQ